MADKSNMTRSAKKGGGGAGSMEGYTSGPRSTAPSGGSGGGRGSGDGDNPCVTPMGPMTASVINKAMDQQSGRGVDWMLRSSTGAARQPRDTGTDD